MQGIDNLRPFGATSFPCFPPGEYRQPSATSPLTMLAIRLSLLYFMLDWGAASGLAPRLAPYLETLLAA